MTYSYIRSPYIVPAGLLFLAWNQGYRLITSGVASFLSLDLYLKLQSDRVHNPVWRNGIGYFAAGSISFYF